MQNLLCSAITVYAHILEHPYSVEAMGDIAIISSVTRFVRKRQKKGCDVDCLLTVCTELDQPARLAMMTAPHTSSAKGFGNAVGFDSPDYMPLVQGLMGNTPLLRAKASDILYYHGQHRCNDDGSILVGPISLRPSTYGFDP